MNEVIFADYDVRGLPGRVTRNGIERTLWYDADGRLLEWHEPWGDERLVITRDVHGRPVETERFAEGDLAGRVRNVFDDEDRLTVRCQELEAGGCDVLMPPFALPASDPPASRVDMFAYTPDGKLATRWEPAGLRTDWSWSVTGELVNHRTSSGDSPLAEETLAYSVEGLLATRTLVDLSPSAMLVDAAAPLVQAYAYDGFDRLVRADSHDGITTSWTWTAADDVSGFSMRPAPSVADGGEDAPPLWYEWYGYDLHRQRVYTDVQGLSSTTVIPGPWGRANIVEATGAGTRSTGTPSRRPTTSRSRTARRVNAWSRWPSTWRPTDSRCPRPSSERTP